MTKTDNEVRWSRQRRTLFRIFYGRYLRPAVAGLLKVASEAMNYVHGAKFNFDGPGDEEETAVCGDLEKLATMAL